MAIRCGTVLISFHPLTKLSGPGAIAWSVAMSFGNQEAP